jgi:hypothetical protein
VLKQCHNRSNSGHRSGGPPSLSEREEHQILRHARLSPSKASTSHAVKSIQRKHAPVLSLPTHKPRFQLSGYARADLPTTVDRSTCVSGGGEGQGEVVTLDFQNQDRPVSREQLRQRRVSKLNGTLGARLTAVSTLATTRTAGRFRSVRKLGNGPPRCDGQGMPNHPKLATAVDWLATRNLKKP